MRVPSYRIHSSGQARITFFGRDFLLGAFDSPESWAKYGRLIAEYKATKGSTSFGKLPVSLLMAHVLLDYLKLSACFAKYESPVSPPACGHVP
jgi:hypothetical protein